MNIYGKFVFVTFLALVAGDDDNGTYIFDSPADKIAGYPSYCYVDEIGLFNNAEPVKQGDDCSTVRCLRNGQYVQTMCPAVEEIEEPCFRVFPTGVPFPKCCDDERIECPPGDPNLE